MCSVLKGRLISDWSIENMNSDMNPSGILLDITVFVKIDLILIKSCICCVLDIQLNLVISKFTGPLQNFEISEIQLKRTKGLSKAGNSVMYI